MTRFLSALALALALTCTLTAFDGRADLVVSTSWLAEHISDANLVILQVGDDRGYPAGHIPGAQLVSLNQPGWAAPRDPQLPLELPSPADLHARLVTLGVTDHSKIVVYQSQAVAAQGRILLTLYWAGLGANTVMLDGGLAAWKAQGHPASTDTPHPTPGQLAPLTVNTSLVVTSDDVQRAVRTPGTVVVDARDHEYYTGEKSAANTGTTTTGHIPGAKNVPYSAAYDDTGALKDPAAIEALFADAGVKPGDTVVAYCHIGQQASATIFAARTLGLNVKLYDGSMADWSNKKLPVETVKR